MTDVVYDDEDNANNYADDADRLAKHNRSTVLSRFL